MSMKLSCCAGLASFVPPTVDAKQLDTTSIYRSKLEKAPAVLKTLSDAGCDFFEFGVGMLCPESPKALFEEFESIIAAFSLKAKCFNSFIPANLKITGPNVDKTSLNDYVAQAAERTSQIGGEVIVFGSGGARGIPEGFSHHQARDQILEFLNSAAQHARQHKVTIAIEPLNRMETNIINSVEEAVQYADEVALPEIKVLVDFYHLMVEKEPFDNIVAAGDQIAHVHVADTDRLYPGSGQYDYQGFAQSLASAGYKGRISVECNFRDFDKEVPQSIHFLRKIFS